MRIVPVVGTHPTSSTPGGDSPEADKWHQTRSTQPATSMSHIQLLKTPKWHGDNPRRKSFFPKLQDRRKLPKPEACNGLNRQETKKKTKSGLLKIRSRSEDKDHPEDPAKIGAISVLRKLANHLGRWAHLRVSWGVIFWQGVVRPAKTVSLRSVLRPEHH